MIRVTKPTLVPAHLARGHARTLADCAALTVNSRAYLDGTKSFKFDETIYGHHSVKTALRNAQHKKCCYCEDLFRSSAPGDVEHFRPKKSVRQDTGHPLEHPGYYWLVYSWPNLYFSCQRCNRSAKNVFFPLANPARRARTHTDDLLLEKPLLLDPGGVDNPRDHIHFHGEVAKGVTAKGQQTIKTLKLNDEALSEDRRKTLEILRGLKNAIALFEALPPSRKQPEALMWARNYLAGAIKPTAEFSAMAQDFLR